MLKIYSDKCQKLQNVDLEGVKNSQITVLGFNSIGKVSYKHELSGADNKLPDLASFSRKVKKVVIAGAVTDNYGILKQSLIIAENGKLLGISDMTLSINQTEYLGGGSFKVYQTEVGRIGLLVGDDIINLDGVKAMSLCDADLIVAVVQNEEKPQYNFLIRAYAYLFGVPVMLLSKTGVIASDMSGEICGKSIENTAKLIIPTQKQYIVVKSKRRGVKE
ncbi:MAG: hypothetical protein IKA54_02430 [Clostridia bacterium]|jgi:predicted amidohydrolase|nr:hypothetical protein [Clostridia bacterium]